MFNNQIIAGSSGQGGGFYGTTIDQSLRLNGVDSNLARTHTAGNSQKFTWAGWVKFSNDNIFSLFETFAGGTDFTQFTLQTSGTINFYHIAGGTDYGGDTTQLLRDPSSWYHIVFRVDTTQASAGDRVRIYVNGTQFETNPFTYYGSIPQNTSTYINTARAHRMGYNQNVGGGGAPTTQANAFGNGYLAEVHFCDGQSYAPTEFGETSNGIWVPIAPSVTYGTNGFHLAFSDTSAIGDDTSGQGNDWTVDDIAASDVVLDSPTNNFPVLIPGYNQETQEGLLKLKRVSSANNHTGCFSTMGVSSGKWYVEIKYVDASIDTVSFGVAETKPGFDPSVDLTAYAATSGISANTHNEFATWLVDARLSSSYTNTLTSYGSALTSGDIVQIALDMDNQRIWYGVNGTYIASGDPANGTNASQSGSAFAPTGEVVFVASAYMGRVFGISFNFGQDSTFAGATTAGGNADGNGYGDFKYAPPSGFLALCSANLDEPAIGPNSTTTSDQNFNTVLYTGTGVARSITGVGFQSDFSWFKERSSTSGNLLFDSVRGAGKSLNSDSTAAEFTSAITLTSFDSDGFSLGTSTGLNQSGITNVAWNWKAGGTAVSNTDGSITTSVSTNADAGISIIKYSGNGTNGATIGHNLGVTPDHIIIKRTSSTEAWVNWHQSFSATQYLRLNATNAVDTATTLFNSTLPSSSVITLGNGGFVNTNSEDYICYAFAEKEGFSKFGTYVGNGNANGTFVYTGHRPSFLLIKETGNANSWEIYDTARDPDNVASQRLFPNTTAAEATTNPSLDILSNGFKARAGNTGINRSGGNYIYLAFAEAPFKYSNAR